MSSFMLNSGIFNQIINSLQALLDHLPCPERTEICIMTFDNLISFYNIPKDLSNEPQV